MEERVRYTYPGGSIVWRDCKAGVVDASGKTIIPFRFDELYIRSRVAQKAAYKRPPVIEYVGFACFTDDGESLAFDMEGKPDQWRDWELPRLEMPPLPERSLEDIEAEIQDRFMKGEDRKSLDDLLHDRRMILNRRWDHTPENVEAIRKVNEMLKESVKEALKTAEVIDKSLRAMTSTPSNKRWMYEIEIVPLWKDFDFRNNLVELGRLKGETGSCPCFTFSASSDEEIDWDYDRAVLNDGVSWDEYGFERPAYQYVDLIFPFQNLSEFLTIAFEDIASIERFEIGIHIKDDIYEVKGLD